MKKESALSRIEDLLQEVDMEAYEQAIDNSFLSFSCYDYIELQLDFQVESQKHFKLKPLFNEWLSSLDGCGGDEEIEWLNNAKKELEGILKSVYKKIKECEIRKQQCTPI